VFKVLTRDIGLVPALLLTLLAVSGLHWLVLRDAHRRNVGSVRGSEEYARLRAAFVKRRSSDVKSLQRSGATLFEAQREVAARFDRQSSSELEKTAPTWRDSLLVQLARALLALYRRAKRSPAEIELEHAQSRGLSLTEYRDRLAEHVLELHRQGRLQAYIARVGKPVPLPPGDDDDDDNDDDKQNDSDDDDDDNEDDDDDEEDDTNE